MAGLGAFLAALGACALLYRVFVMVYVLFVASMGSMCTCGLIDADSFSGGIGGSWTTSGELFGTSDGDVLMQIIFFPASSGMTMAALVMIVAGFIMSMSGGSSEGS